GAHEEQQSAVLDARAAHQRDRLVRPLSLALLAVRPDRPGQTLLAGEVVVQQADAGPGLPGDLGYARPLVAVLQGLTALLRASMTWPRRYALGRKAGCPRRLRLSC